MAKRQWDEKSFFAQLREECSEAACAVARHLLEWFDEQGYKTGYGKGNRVGTLFPYIYHRSQDRVCKLFEILTHDYGKPGCVLMASYLWKNNEWPESPFGKDDKRQQLIANLNRLPLNKQLLKDADNNRPYLTLDSLTGDTLKTFEEVHEWIAKEIRASDEVP